MSDTTTYIGPIVTFPRKSKDKRFDSAVQEILESERFTDISVHFGYRYKLIVLIPNQDYRSPIKDLDFEYYQSVDEDTIGKDLAAFWHHFERELRILKKAYKDFEMTWGITKYTE